MAASPTDQSPDPKSAHPRWLALCRAGYEADCGQELLALAGGAAPLGRSITGAPGRKQLRPSPPGSVPTHGEDGQPPETGAAWLRTRSGSAFVEVVAAGGSLPDAPAVADTVFARQLARAMAWCPGLPAGDRIGPLLAALDADAAGVRYADLMVETPDSDATRVLAPLCRTLQPALLRALARAGRVDPRASQRLHVVFTATDAAWLASSRVGDSRAEPGGIPRLRRLAGAPSRSAAKLDEAFTLMLDDDERDRLLRPGMTAVDLGAAPGGWSWVLARRHLRVSAIDNGPMAPTVLDSGLVTHVRADGFRWRPPQAVDWLVCDMVEQPARVASLAGRWIADGLARRAVVNLKLPMKQRLAEVRRCLDLLRDAAGDVGLDLRCRHLYHDRDEVTVLALPRR